MGIGKRLKEAREKAGLTQEELGKMVGVTGSAITNYEKETSHPKEPVMYALIDALEVDANYLFQDCVKLPAKEKVPTTTEAVLGTELEREVIRLAGNLSDEQKDFFLALLRLTAARNQGLSAADLVSAGEAALKAGHHNPT